MTICDACGEVFQPESPDDDEEVDLEEEGWIDDEDGTYCPEHKNYHPDYVEVNFGQNILE